jgi:hypothetical protein
MNGNFEQLGRTTWFCRPNHYDQSKPYLAGLCARPDQRVRTPSRLTHITCQRACASALLSPRAPNNNPIGGLGQGLNLAGRTDSTTLPPSPDRPHATPSRTLKMGAAEPDSIPNVAGFVNGGDVRRSSGLRRPATPPGASRRVVLQTGDPRLRFPLTV